jgi:uracil-DNA glycosylase family 4
MPNYVPGVGPFNPKLMIVGEAPGKEENEQKIPFVGPTGQIVNDLLRECGISRNDVWMTNVVKYQPPFNDFTKLGLIQVDLQESIQKLWQEEIYALRPNCILAVGDRALEALTGLSGILSYRGSILHAIDGAQKVVPTIHPAALFPKKSQNSNLPWVYLKLIKHDFQRAVDESRTREFNLPDRTHDIASNSLDVYRFFREYDKLKKTSPDIESINCVPVSISFAFNRNHSLTIPLLSKIGNVALTDMTRHEVAECWKFIQEALLEKELVGQNFKYDEYKLGLIGFRCGKLVSDTLLKTHTIFPELPIKKLEVQTSIWTREPYYKEEGKEPKIGRSFDVRKFFIYNGKDSCVTLEIDEEQEGDLRGLGESLNLPLLDFYYNYVMRKHKLYLKIENLGFMVDMARKTELKEVYEGLRELQHDRLVGKIGHEVNVKSYPDIFQLLYREMKFREMKRDPTSEDTITSLLGNHCKGKDAQIKKEILEGILEERRIRDQLSRQINFEPDYDGTCKTSYKISGTETARRSTNILKKPMRPKKIGLSFHTISTHGRLAKDIKSMFIPRKGKVFIKGDASQAEPRIVAVLSQDWELLEVMQARTIDIHRRTAALIFGYTPTLVLKGECPVADKMEKDGPERYTGKTTRMAGLYDVQKHTFMTTFNTNAQKYEVPINISEWRAGQMLELFHNASPLVKKVFHRDIQDALRSSRTLVSPFGRPRIFNARMDEDIFKEGYAFIPQATVADLVDNAALSVDDELGEESCIISENHDALTLEAPMDDWERYARLLKKHMQLPINFGTYCTLKRDYTLIIPCDIEVAEKNYGDMHKVNIELEVVA